MKITCSSCQAKYTIADEKVVGKTVKIKCKKCSATIVVHGDEGAGASESRPPALTMDQSVLGHHGEEPAGGGEEWTVNVSDDDQRTLTTPQLVAEYQRGTLTNDTYVWKDGMGDWLPITGVPELMSLISSPGAAPQLASSPQAMSADASMSLAARPGAAAAAAKKPGRAGAVDLFGAAADASPPAAPGDKLVGERNENSVLFSLSALTAAETAAKAQPARAEIDMRPAAPAKNNGGRGGFDDIMNLGGGISAAPILAPPPLLAPVVEAPAPPAPVAAAYAMGAPAAASYGAPHVPVQQPKSKVGIFVGIGVVVAVLAGVGIYFGTRSPEPQPVAKNDSAASTGATPASTGAAPSPPPTGAAPATAAATEPSAPPSAAAADTGASTPAAATPGQTGPIKGGGGRPESKAASDSKAAPEKPEKPVAAAAEKPAEKAADAPAAAAGGAEFDRGAAMAALGGAAGAARKCAKPDGPTGGGRVKVTFAPSGNVTSAVVEGPPFAGTPVGGCVASMFRSAHVPAFGGSPVVVTKSFSVN